ncbi:MAG TPA: glutathione S-transferase C-terminal domain-containing protein [Planosporangium sp.]|jgi:putative glutathione S-transferase|nr:glutathione S-transferase C-terminal domain-containing protein [Planosporangium sp.]
MTVSARAAGPVDFAAFGPYLPKAEDGKPLGRMEPAFRGRVTADGSSGFPAEPGRYHLYAAYPCPFSQRSTIVLGMKGLKDVVSVSLLDPIRDGRGWAFREGDGHGLDPVNGFAFLAEAYRATDPGYDGHVSVPALWDTKSGRIICNDYRTLSTDLATAFDRWAENPVDLYPQALRPDIDELNGFLFTRVHDGPYRCGFAPTQADYEREVRHLFAALDQIEERLGHGRYLFGPTITESDIRLWVTLVRFDAVYATHFKANLRRITDYRNLWAYARDLYQQPAFRRTVNFDHIKRHYYLTHLWLNPTGIVPLGPTLDWAEPHDRAL